GRQSSSQKPWNKNPQTDAHRARESCCESLLPLRVSVSLVFQRLQIFDNEPPLFGIALPVSHNSAGQHGARILEPLIESWLIPNEVGTGERVRVFEILCLSRPLPENSIKVWPLAMPSTHLGGMASSAAGQKLAAPGIIALGAHVRTHR